MKTKYLFIIPLIAVSLPVHAQSATSFPDAYRVRSSEVPAGFIARPINDEARELGITTNPTVITSGPMFAHLYDNEDTTAITAAYIASYVHKGQESELGVYVIHYQTTESINAEVKKMGAQNGAYYFTKDNYVFIVWSDADAYPEQADMLAKSLKVRLGLHPIQPEPATGSDY